MARRPPEPDPRSPLDIERSFGIMQGKEARVTKHDAERMTGGTELLVRLVQTRAGFGDEQA